MRENTETRFSVQLRLQSSVVCEVYWYRLTTIETGDDVIQDRHVDTHYIVTLYQSTSPYMQMVIVRLLKSLYFVFPTLAREYTLHK